MPDGLPEVPAEMVDSIGDAVEGITPAAPAEPSNLTTPETTATPEGSTEAEAATDAPDSFTKLDPNALPPEVRPFYDSMLSDYTRKTQEVAPWRKLGEELGVDSPDALKDAAELYAYLQDPNNLQQFHAQLSQAFGQASQPVPGQVPGQPATTPEPSPYGLEDSGLEDPAVAQLKQELDGLKSYLQQSEQVRQQEAVQWQLLGEMNRQEAMLKEQHPEWGDEEWNALWNTSVATDGNLVQAAAVIEAAQNAAVTRLLNGKAQAASTEGLTPVAPSRIATQVSEPDYSDHELRNETAQAIEFLRQVANQSE